MGMAQVMEANARQRTIAGKKAHPLLPETVRTQGRSVRLHDNRAQERSNVLAADLRIAFVGLATLASPARSAMTLRNLPDVQDQPSVGCLAS